MFGWLTADNGIIHWRRCSALCGESCRSAVSATDVQWKFPI